MVWRHSVGLGLRRGRMAVDGFVETLTTKAHAGIRGGLGEDAQAELTRLFSLLADLDGTLTDRRTTAAVEIALAALLSAPPNVPLARMIRQQLEQRIHARNKLA